MRDRPASANVGLGSLDIWFWPELPEDFSGPLQSFR